MGTSPGTVLAWPGEQGLSPCGLSERRSSEFLSAQFTAGAFRRGPCSAALCLRAEHAESSPWHAVHTLLFTQRNKIK